MHLAVASAIFACGLGIALYLHNILGRWESDNVHTIYRRYAEMLASTLQSQIDLFQVRKIRLRVSVPEQAPGFRLDPRVVTYPHASARGRA